MKIRYGAQATRGLILTNSLLLIASILIFPNSSMANEIGKCFKENLKALAPVTVYFKNDSYKLTRDAKEILDQLVIDAQSKDFQKLTIQGFVSSVGPKSKHAPLSQKRADEVLYYLYSKNVLIDSTVKGQGKHQKNLLRHKREKLRLFPR